MRRIAVLAFLLAGCGTDDPRDPSVEVIATEILAPSCGQVQCHSTTSLTSTYAFDTLATAKDALRKLDGSQGRGSKLMEVLTATGGSRMPPDSPLDPADIKLIERWLGAGAKGL